MDFATFSLITVASVITLSFLYWFMHKKLLDIMVRKNVTTSEPEVHYIITPPTESEILLYVKDGNLTDVIAKSTKLSYYSGWMGTDFKSNVIHSEGDTSKVLGVRFTYADPSARDAVHFSLYSEISKLMVPHD